MTSCSLKTQTHCSGSAGSNYEAGEAVVARTQESRHSGASVERTAGEIGGPGSRIAEKTV